MVQIFIILCLILLNGVFSMSEIAIIQARKTRLQSDANKGSKSAKTALELASNSSKFLSSVQIGITLVGILTGLYSGSEIATTLANALNSVGVPDNIALGLSKTIIVIIVTYFTIVLGELLPKRIGITSPEKVAKIVAGPMYFLSKIGTPLVWLLSKSTSFFEKLLGIKEDDPKVTEDEIISMVQEGTDDGEITLLEQDIVENVFTVGDLCINNIMTLRSDIVYLEKDMTEEEVRAIIEANIFEEYPVVDGGLDNVIGVLSIKDYLLNHGRQTFSLENLVKPPLYFHETMNVYKMLEEMKKRKISRALVCDEFGSLSGFIALKDVIEALIGNLDDAEEEPDIIERADEGGWLVDGQTLLYDFLRHFDIEYEVEEFDYSTVAGLVLDHLEHIPVVGETFEWQDLHFEIVDMDGPRIDKIIVKRIPEALVEEED